MIASVFCAHREIQRTSQDHVQKPDEDDANCKYFKMANPMQKTWGQLSYPQPSAHKVVARFNAGATVVVRCSVASIYTPSGVSCIELYNQHVVNFSNNKIMYTLTLPIHPRRISRLRSWRFKGIVRKAVLLMTIGMPLCQCSNK